MIAATVTAGLAVGAVVGFAIAVIFETIAYSRRERKEKSLEADKKKAEAMETLAARATGIEDSLERLNRGQSHIDHSIRHLCQLLTLYTDFIRLTDKERCDSCQERENCSDQRGDGNPPVFPS